MTVPAKNMLNPARVARDTRQARPIMSRACPNLISAGRFTMYLRPGARQPRVTGRPSIETGSHATNSQPGAGNAHRSSISSVVWVLECFTQGQMDLAIEQGKPHRVGPGWASLYSPSTRYYEYALPDQACHSIVIYFDPGQGDILKRLQSLNPAHRLIHDPQQQLAQIAQRVVQQIFGQDADQLAAMGDFLHAMSLLCSCGDDGQMLTIGTSVEDDMVTRVRHYMRQHLHETIGIADMANHCSMSESGFAHAYRRLAGASPMNDLRKFRVEAVKMQLLHNRLTLAQIAELTGFSDAFHLSHAFRKVAGISPRQFKQQAFAGSTNAGQKL